ncbi:tRNA (adenosine(37)-N6)-dimethylallyltransferase MiaA [Terrimonas sp. NA20]|uniref:tRNA dimethylallyltransferase n=1 Tax=Terrimonas ginsenosidimutans TaxID=2908004 RepID=A0ABS9KTS2_9BACT|nr:tRNA (adenosine(37)-N6)-dimethylallyltransferase MiaA [Terrimonas ginsenosidimutans]
MYKKTVIVVAGPTAVGKTAVAIDLALAFDTSIISADSRQCFRELSIGVARPSEEELRQVHHDFIASHSITEEITAASFEQYSLQKASDIFLTKDIAVLAGGTGLYIKAFCEGLDEVPAVPVEVRARITAQYEAKGMEWLQEQLREKDPAYFEKGEMKNPQRMMRALEVVETTGRSVIDFRTGRSAIRDFNIIKIGLELPREFLYQRINARVDDMIAAGLIEEVESLLPFRSLNALQTVGYAELFASFDNTITLERAIELIKQNTRRYSKRQMTWFKKDPAFTWFSPQNFDSIIGHVREQMRR